MQIFHSLPTQDSNANVRAPYWVAYLHSSSPPHVKLGKCRLDCARFHVVVYYISLTMAARLILFFFSLPQQSPLKMKPLVMKVFLMMSILMWVPHRAYSVGRCSVFPIIIVQTNKKSFIRKSIIICVLEPLCVSLCVVAWETPCRASATATSVGYLEPSGTAGSTWNNFSDHKRGVDDCCVTEMRHRKKSSPPLVVGKVVEPFPLCCCPAAAVWSKVKLSKLWL